MIPRLEDWPAGGTSFYLNMTRDDIWPATVDASIVPDHCSTPGVAGTRDGRPCPAGGWEALNSGFVSLSRTARGIDSTDVGFNGFYGHAGHFPVPSERALIAMGTVNITSLAQLCISDALLLVAQMWSSISENESVFPNQVFQFRRSATFSIEEGVLQPWTMSFCAYQNVSSDAESYDTTLAQPSDESVLLDWTFDLNPADLKGKVPSMRFAEVPDGFLSSLVAIVILPSATFSDKTDHAAVLTCPVLSEWAASKPFIQNKRKQQRSWTVESDFYYTVADRDASVGSATPIAIDPSWAAYLNPTVDSDNTTVFSHLFYAAGFTDMDPDRDLIAHIISIMVTNGLARTGYTAGLQGSLLDDSVPGWYRSILPKRVYGKAWDSIWSTDGLDTSNMLQATVQVTVNGYGFWSESKTVIAAIIVILLYCSLVVAYVVYAVISGVTYMSWDSITEITALAMQSEKTSRLENTSAGISGNTVYATGVRLRAVDGCVKLLFDDTEVEGSERVQPNIKYH